MAVALAIAYFVSGASASGGTDRSYSNWSIQRTRDPSDGSSVNLSSVSCTAVGHCVAVGGGAYGGEPFKDPLIERLKKGRWTIEPAEVPPRALISYLTGIDCASKSRCTAVGYSLNDDKTYSSVAETWDGSTWSLMPLSDPAGALLTWLTDVTCPDLHRCIAAGFAIQSTARGEQELAITQEWDGLSWTLRILPAPADSKHPNVLGVSCSTANACTAVGTFVDHGTHPLVERWDGASWTIQPTPDLPDGRDGYFSSVVCPDASTCVAVGSMGPPNRSKTLVETWDGITWRVQDTPTPKHSHGGAVLSHVSCPRIDACLAVGSYVGGPNGALVSMLAERWDGTKWSLTHPAVPDGAALTELFGTSCLGNLACVAVGDHAKLGRPHRTLAEFYDG